MSRDTTSNDHFCPGCGTACQHAPRYPWHFCSPCRGQAVDRDGTKIDCFNTHASGGFAIRFEGNPQAFSCRGIIAFINNRRVYISEARFGGTVAQPIRDTDDIRNKTGIADLTHRAAPPENLRPFPPVRRGRSGRGVL